MVKDTVHDLFQEYKTTNLFWWEEWCCTYVLAPTWRHLTIMRTCGVKWVIKDRLTRSMCNTKRGINIWNSLCILEQTMLLRWWPDVNTGWEDEGYRLGALSGPDINNLTLNCKARECVELSQRRVETIKSISTKASLPTKSSEHREQLVDYWLNVMT